MYLIYILIQRFFMASIKQHFICFTFEFFFLLLEYGVEQ